MATSGTYAFNPSLGEVVPYAYQLIGIRPSALLQEHMEAARMATNMMFMRWSNQGVNLWEVQLGSIALVQGQTQYSIPSSSVVILDAYIRVTSGTTNTDRLILPISRSEYSSYPNKAQQGFPTVYWMDRLLSPSVYLWPVPDGNETSFNYYYINQIQDTNLTGAQTMDIPSIWLEAMVYGLSYRLAQIWAPEKAVMIKQMSDESYDIASRQNVEVAQQYISPTIAGYFNS